MQIIEIATKVADEVVKVGEIDQEHVMTPHIFVDYIVDGGKING